MFKIEEASLTSPSYHQPEQVSKKAQSLLNKFDNIQSSIQNEKSQKFRKILGDLLNIEKSIEQESNVKKENYNKLLSKVAEVTHQVEDEKKKIDKFKILLLGKIDSFRNANERMFEKLRTDRISRQSNLDKFIEEKINWLFKRNPSSGLKKSLLKTDQIHEDLNEIKNQITLFFNDLEKQESQTKSFIYSTLQSHRNAIKQEANPKMYDESIQIMKDLHCETAARVNKLAQKRMKMEENTLNILEQVFESLSKGAAFKY